MRAAVVALLTVVAAYGSGFQAGAAKVPITPRTPVWLTGFAARTSPATTVGLDLYARAVALEDPSGYRVVIVTADLLGVTREITSEVAERLQKRTELGRMQVLFNASHTHSGPAVWPRLDLAPFTSPERDAANREYGRFLADQFEAVAMNALGHLEPVTLTFGWAQASFAMNRRAEQLATLRPGEHFAAPVDSRVPVLRMTRADGRELAVLFGYACHNTVLTSTTNEVSGDYAGYAAHALERDGAVALFITLCAGDQRPMPRGSRELAIQHGEALAESVTAVRGTAVHGRLRAAYAETRLGFQVHGREVYAAEAASSDFFLARRGRAMLAAMDAGKPVLDTPYPAQAIAIGHDFVLLALGGEVVVDYALRLRDGYPGIPLIVAAYSNDVMGYIPSRRMLDEGGYEAGDAMMYYVQPGWFRADVEDRVMELARRVLSQAGVNR